MSHQGKRYGKEKHPRLLLAEEMQNKKEREIDRERQAAEGSERRPIFRLRDKLSPLKVRGGEHFRRRVRVNPEGWC